MCLRVFPCAPHSFFPLILVSSAKDPASNMTVGRDQPKTIPLTCTCVHDVCAPMLTHMHTCIIHTPHMRTCIFIEIWKKPTPPAACSLPLSVPSFHPRPRWLWSCFCLWSLAFSRITIEPGNLCLGDLACFLLAQCISDSAPCRYGAISSPDPCMPE